MCSILFASPVASPFPEHKQLTSRSGGCSIFPITCYKGAKVTNLPNLLFNFFFYSLSISDASFCSWTGFPWDQSDLSFFPPNSNRSRLYASPFLQCLFGMVLACQGIRHDWDLFCPCIEWETWKTILGLQTRAAQVCFQGRFSSLWNTNMKKGT